MARHLFHSHGLTLMLKSLLMRSIELSYDFDMDTVHLSPIREHYLLYAILDRTIKDLKLVHPGNKEESVEFLSHYQENPTDKAPWTFNWICEQLEIDPGRFITGLKSSGML